MDQQVSIIELFNHWANIENLAWAFYHQLEEKMMVFGYRDPDALVFWRYTVHGATSSEDKKPEDLKLLETQTNQHDAGPITIYKIYCVSVKRVKKGRS